MMDIKNSLRCTSFFLIAISSWPHSSNAPAIVKGLNLAHFIFIMVLMSLQFIQISLVIKEKAEDPEAMTEILSTQVLLLHVLAKVGTFRFHRDKVKKLIDSLKQSIENATDELRAHLQDYAVVGNLVYGGYIASSILIVFDSVTIPLFKKERTLPYVEWYPFDCKNSTIGYAIAYTHQTIVTPLCACSIGMDIIFGVFVFHCCGELKVLQENLLGLTKRVERNDRIGDRIAACVAHHCDIFEDIEAINDIFTYIVMVLLFSAIITICCAGFQLTSMTRQSINSQIFFFLLVALSVLQLLYYYLPGNLLIDEALAVGFAAYDSCWESLPPEHQKSIALIIMRSANPPKLQVGRLGPLLLEDYASFLTTTASYFTSLKAVTGSS